MGLELRPAGIHLQVNRLQTQFLAPTAHVLAPAVQKVGQLLIRIAPAFCLDQQFFGDGGERESPQIALQVHQFLDIGQEPAVHPGHFSHLVNTQA